MYSAVSRAIQRGDIRRAIYLIEPFLHDNYESISELLMCLGVAPIIAKLLNTLVFEPLLYRVIQHALHGLVAKDVVVAEYKTTNTYRGFTISTDACLVWRCQIPPMTKLIGAPMWILETPTNYWQNKIRENRIAAAKTKQGVEYLKIPESHSDTFYTSAFPNDIPDEWSDAERAKSHGLTLQEISKANIWFPGFWFC